MKPMSDACVLTTVDVPVMPSCSKARSSKSRPIKGQSIPEYQDRKSTGVRLKRLAKACAWIGKRIRKAVQKSIGQSAAVSMLSGPGIGAAAEDAEASAHDRLTPRAAIAATLVLPVCTELGPDSC